MCGAWFRGVENTKCSCCSNGHLDEFGQSIICDREVVNECIKIWFGDQKGFEETIQTAVVEARKPFG